MKGLRFTLGSSWLHHRSRHDLPERPGIPRAMRLQFLAPNLFTSRLSIASSSGDQGPFTRSSAVPAPPKQPLGAPCSSVAPSTHSFASGCCEGDAPPDSTGEAATSPAGTAAILLIAPSTPLQPRRPAPSACFPLALFSFSLSKRPYPPPNCNWLLRWQV